MVKKNEVYKVYYVTPEFNIMIDEWATALDMSESQLVRVALASYFQQLSRKKTRAK